MSNQYEARCEGRLVAVVYYGKHRRWIIAWPTRQWARENIDDLESAKAWIAGLLHGKTVEWAKVKKED